MRSKVGRMKKLLNSLVVVSLLAVAAIAQNQDSPFKVSDIKATQASPTVVNVQLTTTTVNAITPAPTVPVANSQLLLTGEIPLGQIDETNVLGSFMADDLDGDDIAMPLLLRQSAEGLRFDGVLIETMGELNGPQTPYRENKASGEMKRYLLSPESNWFSVLYYTPPALGLLLTHRTEEPEVLELPNPHLQIVIFEHSDPVNVPRFLPDPPSFDITVDGKEPVEKHLLYAWEPELFAQLKMAPQWIRAYWIAVPLEATPGSKQHNLQVKLGAGDSALGMYAQVNYATEPGVRLRTNRSVGVIYAPPKE